MIKKIFLSIIVVVAPVLYAANGDINLPGLFTPVATDLSLNYLRMLFGTVGDALVAIDNPGDNLVAGLFNIFNTGLLLFVGGFISYTIFHSTLGAAQDGGGAQQGKKPVWSAFRMVLGLSLLAPMYNGYSMAQITVMWTAVSGVGVAGSIWDYSVDHLVKTGGGVLAPAHVNNKSDLYQIASNTSSSESSWQVARKNQIGSMTDLMASATCLAVLNKSTNDLVEEVMQASSANSFNSIEPKVRVGQDCVASSYNNSVIKKNIKVTNNTICFGVKTDPGICGVYTWNINNSSVSDSVNNSAASSIGALLNINGSQYFSVMEGSFLEVLLFLDKYALQGKRTDFSNLRLASDSLKKDKFLNFICDVEQGCVQGRAIADGALQYYTTVLPARLKPDEDADGLAAREAWGNEAKANGWIMAGQSYYNFTTAENTPPSVYEAIRDFQFKVKRTVPQSMIDLISSADSYNYCIQNKNNKLGAITFKNLGKLIGELNGSASDGGAITLSGTSNYVVSTCILMNNLVSYAKSANASISLSGEQESNRAVSTKLVSSHLDYVTAAALQILLQDNIFNNIQTRNDVLWGFPVFLNVVEDNITAMLLNIYGKLLGFYPFETNKTGSDLAATFSDGSANANGARFNQAFNEKCLNARNYCLNYVAAVQPNVGSQIMREMTFWASDIVLDAFFPAVQDSSGGSLNDLQTGCFDNAVNIDQCIQKGQGILGSIASAKEGSLVDPILVLSNLGIDMINNAVLYWTKTVQGLYTVIHRLGTHYLIVMGVAGGVGSVVSGLSAVKPGSVFLSRGSDFASAAVSFINQFLALEFKFVALIVGLYLPLGVALSSLFFVMGVTLGLYVPLIPFLIFLFSAIGWLIAVVEAMVAAPLIALGVTYPVGYDLLGKAEKSIDLLLGIFIRPIAMIIGFLFAIVLVYVAMELFNTGFLSVIVNYLNNNASVEGQGQAATVILGFCGILMIYVYIVLAIVNQCFAIIYQVQERLLRWIGGAPEHSYSSQIMQDVYGGAVKDSSAKAAQAGSAPSSKVPSYRAQAIDANQKEELDKDKLEGSLVSLPSNEGQEQAAEAKEQASEANDKHEGKPLD